MTNQNKILFLINKFKRGGAERIFLRHINYLEAQGHEVYLGVVFDSIETKNFFAELRIAPDKVKVFGFKQVFDWKMLKELREFVSDNEITVIYSTLEDANILARLVRTFDSSLKVFVRESGMADRKSLKNKIFDIVLNFWSEKIIAVSDEVAGSLGRCQPMHRRKIIVLPNFVDLPDKNPVEKKVDRFVILNVGSMKNDNKGQLSIIKAVQILRDQHGLNNLKLILAGDGKLRPALEKYTLDNGLADSVEFTGVVDSSKINELYQSADLYIQFSKTEGCANTVLEACAFAMPIISTKVGGVSGVVKDGVNGFILDRRESGELAEKIKYFIDNPEKTSEFGKRSFEIIKKDYTVEKKTEELLRIFFED